MAFLVEDLLDEDDYDDDFVCDWIDGLPFQDDDELVNDRIDGLPFQDDDKWINDGIDGMGFPEHDIVQQEERKVGSGNKVFAKVRSFLGRKN